MPITPINAFRRLVRRSSGLFLLGVLASTAASALAQAPREWRDADGRVIMTSTDQKLVGTLLPEYDDPQIARIQMGDQTFRFSLTKLSQADRQYVKNARAPKTATKPTATKPTATKPSATKPSATKPTATKPTVSNSAVEPTPTPSSQTPVEIPKDGVKRAFLVGVDDYADFADLQYVGADVEALRARLMEIGFESKNIVALTTESSADLRPTHYNVRRQFDAFLKKAGENDFLFVYFSGRAFQTGDVVRFAPEDAVATNDSQTLDPAKTISTSEVVDRLKTSRAKFKWLTVDICRENPNGARNGANALKNLAPTKGILVLQSCSEGEFSREDKTDKRGLFVGGLLEALNGEADFDNDGAISALDACKYASEETAATSKTRFNEPQTPYFRGDITDFIVADNLKKHGVPRKKWAQADALYAEALALVREKKFETAQKKIDEALSILDEVPETNEIKKRYLKRKEAIDAKVEELSWPY